MSEGECKGKDKRSGRGEDWHGIAGRRKGRGVGARERGRVSKH